MLDLIALFFVTTIATLFLTASTLAPHINIHVVIAFIFVMLIIFVFRAVAYVKSHRPPKEPILVLDVNGERPGQTKLIKNKNRYEILKEQDETRNSV